MVTKTSNSSSKRKNNNSGKMFIKRENNNTWIMLGLVLVLCVAVYYYVTSKNNDRTEEQFENSLCPALKTTFITNYNNDNKGIELLLKIKEVGEDNIVELKAGNSVLIDNDNDEVNDLKNDTKELLQLLYKNKEDININDEMVEKNLITMTNNVNIALNNNNNLIGLGKNCDLLLDNNLECDLSDDIKNKCDKVFNIIDTVEATTTTQAEATTTTQAEATTTTQAEATASNNANDTSTETQEMYQRVRNEVAQLYNSADGELSDFLKEGLKSLTPSQRKSICQTYCTSFTPCTELCKLTECANCTGSAIGDTDMSGMGLPDTSLGYAGIDDQYVLLDNVDDNTAGLNVKANLENLGNKSQVGPHIVQKDTNGISNIFAPYIIMTPKRKNETYGTYLLEDPNDPFQKRFVESVLANY